MLDKDPSVRRWGSSATGVSTFVIIDALDECRDEESASVILSILSRYVDQRARRYLSVPRGLHRTEARPSMRWMSMHLLVGPSALPQHGKNRWW